MTWHVGANACTGARARHLERELRRSSSSSSRAVDIKARGKPTGKVTCNRIAYDGRARAVEHDSNGVLQAIMGIRYAPGVAGERLEAEAKAVARAASSR